MVASNELRAFMARLLGWMDEPAVELALRSIDLAANHRAALVLCGAGDLVPIAHALHRRALGADRPFVVCDPRRGDSPPSVRAPASCRRGSDAVVAALGGSLCMRARRPPRDYVETVARLRGVDDVMLVLCAEPGDEASPLLARPAPVLLPPLAGRADELAQIIDEFAADALAELGAPASAFTDADRAWVREYASDSLAAIEKATLRLVALRAARNVTQAAKLLGMAPVSLSTWLGRRSPAPRAEP